MIRFRLLAAVAALAIGTAHAATDDDFTKQAIDATRPLQMDLGPDGTPTPSDLTFDTGFTGTGMRAIWPSAGSGWSETDDGLRVFPWIAPVTVPGPPPTTYNKHMGYYVIGKQKDTAGSSWRVWIMRVTLIGSQDSGFGTDGWIYGSAQDDIVDAVVVGDKAYVLSNIWGDTSTPITRVSCIDLTTPTGDSCFAGFGGALSFGAAAGGPRTAAYGQRMTYDSRYGLFVAARVMNNVRGQEVGIARISADTGALVTEFKDDGYNISLPSEAPATGVTVTVNALSVTPEGYTGIPRVYVAAEINRAALGDTDSFIIGLAPTNGIFTTGWNWGVYYYESDNTTFKRDVITALTPLRNGKVAFAGWSETDDVNARPMIMGRIGGDGSYDSGFCEGNAHAGALACLVDPPYSTGSPLNITYTPFSQPVALAERRQNRDLVVVQRFQDNGFNLLFPDDHRVRTLVQQFSASGNRKHAVLTIDYRGSTGVLWSRPFGMWMGGTGQHIASGGLGEEVIAIVGTRQWYGDDFDATLTHLKATDSIFADAFGGANGD